MPGLLFDQPQKLANDATLIWKEDDNPADGIVELLSFRSVIQSSGQRNGMMCAAK